MKIIATKRHSVLICLSVLVLIISSFVARIFSSPFQRIPTQAFLIEQGNRILSVHTYYLLIILSVLLLSFIIGLFMAFATHFRKTYDGLLMLPVSIIGVILSFILPSRLNFQPYAHSGEVVSIGNCFITAAGWCLAFSIYSLFHKKTESASTRKTKLLYILLPLAVFMLAFVFDHAISSVVQAVMRMSMDAGGAHTAATLGFVLPYAISVIAGCTFSLMHMATVGRINAYQPAVWTLSVLLILFILRIFAPYSVMILFPNEGYYLCATISGYMLTLFAASLFGKPQEVFMADQGTTH